MPGLMYEVDGKRVTTWNPFVGCFHRCVYCVSSFQRIMKRQKNNCQRCYDFLPHFHPERLNRIPPGDLIFACAFGDVCFAAIDEIEQILVAIEKHPKQTFLLQSKNPSCFLRLSGRIPSNAIIGTTLETNRELWPMIGVLLPYARFMCLRDVVHPRKFVTVEPIMKFDLDVLCEWIELLAPEFVYVGYENHGCKLPEPSLEETLALIERLKCVTEVRIKTLRERNVGGKIAEKSS